jgi:hypothetical protein
MCGIAGILEFGRDARANAAALREMCRVITHRGPDDEGFYTDGAAGIGMRRLSIVDVAGGHQPISNEDGTLWIVFNGEIYNHLALREQHAQRHRNGYPPLRRVRRGLRAAPARHVRLRHLEPQYENAFHRARPLGHQAAVLQINAGTIAVRIGN